MFRSFAVSSNLTQTWSLLHYHISRIGQTSCKYFTESFQFYKTEKNIKKNKQTPRNLSIFHGLAEKFLVRNPNHIRVRSISRSNAKQSCQSLQYILKSKHSLLSHFMLYRAVSILNCRTQSPLTVVVCSPRVSVHSLFFFNSGEIPAKRTPFQRASNRSLSLPWQKLRGFTDSCRRETVGCHHLGHAPLSNLLILLIGLKTAVAWDSRCRRCWEIMTGLGLNK